MIFWRTIFMP